MCWRNRFRAERLVAHWCSGKASLACSGALGSGQEEKMKRRQKRRLFECIVLAAQGAKMEILFYTSSAQRNLAILASHRTSNEFENAWKPAMKTVLPEEVPLREGANAIYVEPRFIAYVRVSDIQVDDWGVKALITVVPTRGMQDEGKPSYNISAAWTVFSNSYDHWHAIYVNWSVYFGVEEVKAGLELAARAAALGSRVELREMRSALETIQMARLKSDWRPARRFT